MQDILRHANVSTTNTSYITTNTSYIKTVPQQVTDAMAKLEQAPPDSFVSSQALPEPDAKAALVAVPK